MGFIPDIERIFQLTPPKRQTLFFSATMAPEIERITRTATPTPGTPGLWRVEGLVLPVAGRWTVDLDVRRTRFNLVKLGSEILIK
jgi:hypothetical protein